MPNRYQLSPTVQQKLQELNTTAEEVIRKALNIKAEGLTAEGVMFPEGAIFLTCYKDEVYSGKVKEGAIELQGERYTSVSAAAAKITGRPTTNGWAFWTVRLPGKNEFVPIANLRKP